MTGEQLWTLEFRVIAPDQFVGQGWPSVQVEMWAINDLGERRLMGAQLYLPPPGAPRLELRGDGSWDELGTT